MPIVRFVNENVEINVDKGTTIAKAERKAGVYCETPCSGAGTCGKCKVKISDKSAVNIISSTKKLSLEEIEENIVLACHTQVIKDIDVITLDNEEKDKSLDILSEGYNRKIELFPNIYKNYSGTTTKIYTSEEILGTEEGNTECHRLIGVSVDIGTTTIVTALVDLENGKEICSISDINPQCKYAQDVVSRIQYCSANEEGLNVLFSEVADTINRMINKLCEKEHIDSKYIYEIIYSGNTTMLHLATNTDPYLLGQYPYESEIKGNEYKSAIDCRIHISPFGRVYLPPIISSYVGADIVSGILSCALENSLENILFIDIGTNGEMVLASNGTLTATSTAAGPAFEGMNISCGMRADSGAVEGFIIDDNYQQHVRTIKNEKAVGICGSGLFDIVGELARIGVIEKNGHIIKKEKCKLPDCIKNHIVLYEGKPAYEVAEKVYLTQLDIRQVQLAKSAIRAGIEAMLDLNSMSINRVDKVYIAGSFGYHIRVNSLIDIGIIPEQLKDRVEFVGNTSKTGGNTFLLDYRWRNKMEQVVRKIKAIDLSDHKDFENMFIRYMSF